MGQGAAAPTGNKVASSQATPSNAGQPFFSYKNAEGKEEVYNSKEDLEKAYKESYFRTKDYTQKTQNHAREVEKYKKEREAWEKERSDFQKMKEQYDGWDKALKSRPDIQQILTRAATTPMGPQSVYDRSTQYVDEKYGSLSKELEDLKAFKQQYETERERDSIYKEMQAIDPNFDSTKVSSVLEELSTGELRPLIKILWDAVRGRESPAKVEAKIKKNLEGKAAAPLIPGSGKPSAEVKYRTPREAHDAALASLGV
jgi:vacuolar-type H+-ATPase subunit I/STV1